MSLPIRQSLDWGQLVPLRLVARGVADGVYSGIHRSPRRGSGVEFGGHRSYVPGDDLRWLDRHALMRHGRLLVRQFETETDRALSLVMDASASMAYRSSEAPGAKLAYAAVLAAALGRVALSAGDPVSLNWLGGHCAPLSPSSGREAFERLVGTLEAASPGGDLSVDDMQLDRTLTPIARRGRRGSIVIFFSDLLDLPPKALDRLAGLGARQQLVLAVRVLDPQEARFSFEGPLRLRAAEGDTVVETDAEAARADYLEALERIAAAWDARLLQLGGRLIRAVTTDDPVEVVRKVLLAIRGGQR